LYQEINKGFDQAQNSQLSNYLQSKVAKMPREYLELLFSLIFEDIENKDEVVNAIVQGQAQPNIIQNIKKTIIKPQFNIIPYNIRSIENILNRVYSIDKSDQKPETKNNIQTQTGIDIGASKQDTSTIHINTLRTLKNSSKS
jgi:Mg2+/Co2+ transporter CorC